jgi:hypothetical protein
MRRITILLTLAILLLLAGSVLAQSSDDTSTWLPSTTLGTGSAGYDLSWWTVDSGGYTFSTGGNYTLGGTIGQPDAGTLTGGGYTLGGGFWGGGAVAVEYKVYLPVVLRNYP